MIVFIVWLLIGIWVYKDAERRGKSGILWFFVILLLGLIGIIIWLVVRPPIGGDPNQQAGSGRICPDCGRSIPMDARICPYCTKVFHDDHMTQQPTLKYCPHCGSRNKIDATFCEKCGSQI